MNKDLIKEYIYSFGITEELKEEYQLIKASMYESYLSRVQTDYLNKNEDLDIYLNDYFEFKVKNIKIVASENIINNIECIPVNMIEEFNHWIFQGFCIIDEFEDLDECYEELKEKYCEYQKLDDCLLILDVIGGVINGKSIIDKKTCEYWKNKGIVLISVGDKKGELIKKDNIFGDEYKVTGVN